jgi:hypothetical protein
MSSTFIDYLDSGKYVNDKNLEVQKLKVASTSASLPLANDENGNVISSTVGSNLVLARWGNSYSVQSIGTNMSLPFIQVGGGFTSLNSPFQLSGSTIVAPSGAKGGYKANVSYYNATSGLAGITLRLDGTAIGTCVPPNDTSAAGFFYFEVYFVIPDNLAHTFTITYSNNSPAPIQLGNVNVSITKISQ